MSRLHLAPVTLLLWLCPSLAQARHSDRAPADAPLNATADAPGAEPPRLEPEIPAQRPLGRRPVMAPPQTTLDAPVGAGAWAVYGAFSLVPLGGIYGASRLGEERLWVPAAQTLAGGVVGSLPGSLLFLQPPSAGGRWAEPDVMAFGTGLVLTPPLAALGTWGLGELTAGEGRGGRERGQAFLGALSGAAVGTLLGVALHGVLEEVVGNREALQSFRKTIALGFIGSSSTVGYQWARGSRPRIR
ncbi:MAG: hypothetical protein ABW123_19640 [Cystobacter sp.]